MTSYNSRSTGEQDGVDDNRNLSTSQSQHFHPHIWPTIFANKLVDLAISADDAEVAENQRKTALPMTSTVGEVGVDKTPVSMDTFVTDDPYENGEDDEEEEEQNEDFEMSWTKVDYSALEVIRQTAKAVCISKFKVDDSGGGAMNGRNRKESQENSTNGIIRKGANGLHQQSPDRNLLTVFSSPCQDYFRGSRNSKNGKNELPEFVRVMMEKDLALKRLVKTGSVTISQVSEQDRSEDDEKFLDDDDYLYDEYREEESEGHPDKGRPYVPLGNIDDWEEFPFAKRLLQFAHMSISVSSNASSPARSDTISTNSSITPILRTNVPSTILNAPNMPNPTQTHTKKVKTNCVTPSGSGVYNSTKRPFIIERRHEVAVVPSGSRNQSRPSHPPPLCAASNLPNGNTVNGDKKKTKLQRKKVIPTSDTNNGSDDGDDLSTLHMDPMKFLEVSLDEGRLESKTIPDDSHRRKYKCNICEKKFCWSTDLKRHILIHTGERPFKCTECPANFTRKFLMQKHFKKVHQSQAGHPYSERTPKLDSSPVLQVTPRLLTHHTTDEEESGSGSGDAHYAVKNIHNSEYSFDQLESVNGESIGPDEEYCSEEDYVMDEGRSDEDGHGVELNNGNTGRVNGYGHVEDRRVSKVTYLDF